MPGASADLRIAQESPFQDDVQARCSRNPTPRGVSERGPFGAYRPDPLSVFMERELRAM